MTCTNAAANRLHNDASAAATVAERKRNKAKEDRHNVQLSHSLGYAEGKAIAYSNADEILRAELRRLMNRFQNGSLSMEDFGIDP